MFGKEIGGLGNSMAMLGLMAMLGCSVIDCGLFMQSLCSMYSMRHDGASIENQSGVQG